MNIKVEKEITIPENAKIQEYKKIIGEILDNHSKLMELHIENGIIKYKYLEVENEN